MKIGRRAEMQSETTQSAVQCEKYCRSQSATYVAHQNEDSEWRANRRNAVRHSKRVVSRRFEARSAAETDLLEIQR